MITIKEKTWENLDTSLKSTWGNPQEDLEKLLTKIIQGGSFQASEKYRAAIILRHLRDLEYEEIAQVLDLPLNTVKTHIRREGNC